MEDTNMITEGDHRPVEEVAIIMDEWTRQENTAYAKKLAELTKELEDAKAKIARYEVRGRDYLMRLNRMAQLIVEADDLLQIYMPNRDEAYRVIHDHDNVPDVVTAIDLTTDEEIDELMEELMGN